MDKDIKQIYKEIESSLFQSDLIKNSKFSKSLLTYLLNCSFEGITPKEITIAAEVFNKDQHFNPGEDPLIRVHVHNLRKKLEEYYKGEGKNDRFYLEIPKGQYVIHITDRADRQGFWSRIRQRSTQLKLYPIAIVLLAVLCVSLLFMNWHLDRQLEKYHIVESDDPVWSDFIKTQNETMIVCGDHFFYTMDIPFKKRSIHIRDTWVNSEDDMKYVFFPKDRTSVKPSGQSYFPYSSMWALPGIIKVLNSSPRQIVLRSSSQLTANVIEEQNMVFIGNIKSLGLLSLYVQQANIRYDLRERILYHITATDTVKYVAEANEDVYHKDYAFIIKWQGPRGNSILMISGFYTIGAKEACRHLTERALLPVLENYITTSCGYVPKNFLVIMQVSGIRQAITDSKFILAQSLNPPVEKEAEKHND
jgi:hypothetical protein